MPPPPPMEGRGGVAERPGEGHALPLYHTPAPPPHRRPFLLPVLRAPPSRREGGGGGRAKELGLNRMFTPCSYAVQEVVRE